MSISIMIVDDQEVVRLGLAQLLAGSDFEIVDEAATASEALTKAVSTKAAVLLLDVRMPETDGLNLLARIKLDRPELPVLLFSAYENPNFVARAVALGAAGYVMKGTTKEELVTALASAARGEMVWTREELRKVTGALAMPRSNFDVEAPLTRRESEVLRYLAQGRTNKQIAEDLQISYETVKEHVQHVLRKIGVNDRTQAAIWAVRTGFVF
jgi:DNA-binding NarL/FixJ family response regulator